MMVSRASSWCYTAVIVAVLTTTLVSADLNHGHFETADGSKCTWFELKKSSSMNTLTAACMCKDATGKGQSYSCQYEGDLRECHEYKHSPRDFYEAVVQRIAQQYDGACEPSEVVMKQCPDVALKKTELQQVSSPCVQQEVTDREEL